MKKPSEIGEDTKLTLDLKTIGIVIAGAVSLALMYTDLNSEIDVAKDLARQEGKPEEMLEKIAMGRLNKFFKENTLLNQEFIKESKTSVSQYLNKIEKDLTVTDFKRVGLGV